MRLRDACVGGYVAVNPSDTTVFEVEAIEGTVLVVKEVVDGSTSHLMKSLRHDVSVFQPATREQLDNAGLRAVTGKGGHYAGD